MTVTEMAGMGGRARAAKYTREQLREFGRNAGRPRKLDGTARRRLKAVLAAGKSQAEYAAELGLSVRTIGRAVARMACDWRPHRQDLRHHAGRHRLERRHVHDYDVAQGPLFGPAAFPCNPGRKTAGPALSPRRGLESEPCATRPGPFEARRKDHMSSSTSAWCKRARAVLVLCAATAIASSAQTFSTLVFFDGTNGSNPRFASLVRARTAVCTEPRRMAATALLGGTGRG
jgi:hypothetical protein